MRDNFMSHAISVPTHLWAWLFLAVSQVLIVVWIETQAKAEAREPLSSVLYGGRPERFIEVKGGRLLDRIDDTIGALMYLDCGGCFFALTAVAFPEKIFYQTTLIVKISWMLFCLEVYVADVWGCWKFALWRHRRRR